MSRPVGRCSRLAGGAVWCRGAQLSCGLAAARRRGAEQCDQSGFDPACRRCFLAEFWLDQFVDKALETSSRCLLAASREEGKT
ncbi:hypothetical protein EMIHUDRAFT_210113 [Emiliania huxleyi CCMP1516]|uniref:Secreted protein n=2 Tax=Emiliania huxleyi TaxID=2903 RepID=A0A0D3J1N3_EMIH1|nr:hypothetical protein EMIHUDRAFT_210113 [Emiliania huxleyi CCMP1516]EOD17418.1 hypothetical protein EMIHUDRAFT_210113 [Emiliania huxleyi CCMP1516]|eukprot:XP_005769847.1 hypothetical protein EMIHUDRAFT_210113 [Emiliania huxleyi CCMP1516]